MRTDFANATQPSFSDAAARDADLVARIRSADHCGAFEMVLDRYETKVFHLCVAMLGDAARAQEVAQDSLLRVWRSLAGYEEARGAVSTWIYAITRNRCLTELGSRQSLEVSINVAGVRDEAERVVCDAPEGDPAAQRQLHLWIAALPPMQRTCLRLFYFEEQSVAQVAAQLELPEGTVKTHLHRARAALLACMKAQGMDHAALWL